MQLEHLEVHGSHIVENVKESLSFVFQSLSCVNSLHAKDCSMPGFPVFHCLPEFAQTHVHWVDDTMEPSHPLLPLLLPSIFPSIRVFSSRILWPKYWSFSFSISPSNKYSGLISFKIDSFDLLLSKGLSRVFSSTTIQRYQLFGAQSFLLSSSHIHTWLHEKL